MSLPPYYRRVNPDLLRLIPPDARLIVEVGCGAGALAAEYRRVNPAVRYVGVERHEAAAREAAGPGRVDRVVLADADRLDLAALDVPPGGADVLVFGDVLEHLADPWTLLTRLVPLLREGGQAVACIPNTQHWSVLSGLMAGRWDYADEGLLDRTHLRFFTLDTMVAMLAGAGLRVFDARPRQWPDPRHDAFVATMGPAMTGLGLDPSAFAGRTAAVQYVVRAVKSSAPIQPLLVQSLLGSPLCARVRLLEADGFAATIPGVRTIASTGACDLGAARPGETRVFVRQRNLLRAPDDLPGQRALIAAGYLIVAEFDDDPLHFPEVERHDFLTFTACHAVQVSTPALAELVGRYHPRVCVVPNALAALPPPRDDPPRDDIAIFFGALNREADWAPILPALNDAIDRLGDRVRVRVVHDRAFFDALRTPHKDFTPLCPFDQYAAILRSCDLALLPLEATRFNAFKSDLKFIECAAHGVVALASPTVYAGTIRDGETGIICNGPGAFAAALLELAADPGRRRAIAAAAYEYVATERMLGPIFRQRYEWYRELYDQLGALNVELRGRVPALF